MKSGPLAFVGIAALIIISVGAMTVIGAPTNNPLTTSLSSTGQLGPWAETSAYPLQVSDPACSTAGGYIYCTGGYVGTTPTSSSGYVTNRSYFARLSSSGIGPWVKTTDYPFAVQDQECFTYSGYVYCVGGDGPNANATDSYGRTDAVFYAPVSSSGIGQWASTTPFPHIVPSPRCMVSGDHIYCISATLKGSGFTSVTDAYFASLSPSGVGTWAPTTAPPSVTVGCSAINQYAYCFGSGLSYYAPLSSEGIGPWSNTTSIPVKDYAGYFTAESYIYFMGIPVYFAPASSSGIGSWESTTNYPNATYPGSCVSSGVHVYCLGGYGTNSSYFADIGVPNPYALHLQNPPPFSNPEFLGPAWTGSGGCSTSFLTNGTFAGAPCFTADIDVAVVFNCLSAAATPTGCKTTVVSPTRTSYNYNMTIWYPDSSLGPSPPDANCAYEPELGSSGLAYAWCITVGQNDFIISQPTPNIQPL